MLALVDQEPRLLSLKRALQIYIEHRLDVLTRRTQFELDKALRRQHILEGLLIALDNLDEIIQTIRNSPSADEARTNLMEGFELSEEQAQAILDMQLRRLAALERQKITDEYQEVTEHIDYLRGLLADKYKLLAIISDDLDDLVETYGDERRTTIVPGSAELNEEDMVRDEDVLVAITQRGYVKRTPVRAYRMQQRGGKGLIGMGTREEDELEHLFAAGTLNTLLFFSDRGKVYSLRTYEIPEQERTSQGRSLMNVLPLMPDERITAALPVVDFEDAEYVTLITRNGRIKRVEVNAFANVRTSGLIAINLDEDDELGWAKMTRGNQDLILVSEWGRGIRFNEEDVRPMGRTAAGVMGIRLLGNDRLAGADVVAPEDDLLLITEKGFGKRTPLSEYRQQNRYGQGVRAMSLGTLTGKIVSARVVTEGDEVTCISVHGIILRTSTNSVSQQSRNSRGVRVMDIREGDSVASVAVIREGRLSNGRDDDSEIDASRDATGDGEGTTREEAVTPA
jgi:DNA gyrase subunit A